MNNLKFIICSLSICIIFSCTGNSTTTTTKTTSGEDSTKTEELSVEKDPIESINSLKARIDKNLKSLSLREHKFEEYPPFIELKLYSKEDKLAKVEYSTGGDHGAITETYFFRENGKLAYAHIEEGGWQFSGEKEGETIDMNTQHEFYFKKEECLQALKKDVTSKEKEFKAAMAKAKFEKIDPSKGNVLIQRAEAYHKLFQENAIPEAWGGMPYLELE